MYRPFLSVLCVFCLTHLCFGIDGTTVLQKTDDKIIPRTAIFSIKVASKTADQQRTYLIRGAKDGSEKTLLVVQAPTMVKDIVHLRKADNIWTYYPSIGKTNRMAYQSIFMDTTLSYGDIISTELTRDYDVIDQTEETLDGQKTYKLILTPKPEVSGYAKIICWVDKKTFLPIKRLYYSVSGVLLKTAKFSKIEFENNRISSLTQTFEEPLRGRITVVQYTDFEFKNSLPDQWFNANTLQFLRPDSLK